MIREACFAVAVASLLTAGCSTTTKVAVNQLGDENLSCSQLKLEAEKLKSVKAEAERNKGVTGTNVAAVLLFWPAVVGNYVDADKAEKLVSERENHLARLYSAKNCS